MSLKRKKCFADNGRNCNALKHKNCINCKFYKSSKEFIDGLEKHHWYCSDRVMYENSCKIAVKNLEV